MIYACADNCLAAQIVIQCADPGDRKIVGLMLTSYYAQIGHAAVNNNADLARWCTGDNCETQSFDYNVSINDWIGFSNYVQLGTMIVNELNRTEFMRSASSNTQRNESKSNVPSVPKPLSTDDFANSSNSPTRSPTHGIKLDSRKALFSDLREELKHIVSESLESQSKLRTPSCDNHSYPYPPPRHMSRYDTGRNYYGSDRDPALNRYPSVPDHNRSTNYTDRVQRFNAEHDSGATKRPRNYQEDIDYNSSNRRPRLNDYGQAAAHTEQLRGSDPYTSRGSGDSSQHRDYKTSPSSGVQPRTHHDNNASSVIPKPAGSEKDNYSNSVNQALRSINHNLHIDANGVVQRQLSGCEQGDGARGSPRSSVRTSDPKLTVQTGSGGRKVELVDCQMR